MNNEEKILGMLETLTAEVSDMKNSMYSMNADIHRVPTHMISTFNEISDLKRGMYGVKAEVTGMKVDMTEIKDRLSNIEQSVSKLKCRLGKVKKVKRTTT